MPPEAVKVKLDTSSTNRSAPQWTLKGRLKDSTYERAPGPGKYGCPSVNERFRSSPSFGFGTSQREFTKKFGGLPGPGAHTPVDPNQTSPMWGFGSGNRLPAYKDRGTPAPGKYELKGAMESRSMTLGGRHAGRGKKRPSSVPGPGAYRPLYDQVEDAPGRVAMGGSSREKGSFADTKTCAPGPGTYPLLKELGGNITTRSCPSFSFTSRRRPPRSDATPGPCFTNYSQF
mmetsp:Transcript_94306/g.219126  ORF Transcript_94306/g.219126 Transcript_94306/m.219126 type:complete len:230 (+) Transcript_94306:166-855(+)